VGVLSPNDVRLEEGWPASSDPTADSIEPPVAGGKPAERVPTNRRHRHRRQATTAVTRSCASTNGGQPMAETEPEVDLSSLEFTPIRGELARAFLKHRVSMRLGNASDEWILDHVDNITLVLVELMKHAIAIDERPWLRRHIWWHALAYALSNNKSGPPLDG
jgi:hypothetical protein